MKNSFHRFSNDIIFEGTGNYLEIVSVNQQSGGCVSHAAVLETNKGSFFLKWREREQVNMFPSEKLGLEHLFNKTRLKVPEPLSCGSIKDQDYLLMEFIRKVPESKSFWESLGTGLAELHQYTTEEPGLSFDNFIGSLKQENAPLSTWPEFFIRRRLNPQLELALQNDLIDLSFSKKFIRIYNRIPDLIPNLPASLLHGDLWSGNILPVEGGNACIIDPAIYYGSREVEIAFTQLFGGFDKKFYQAYEEILPLAPGFKERIAIYNIYPLLVHANMFGPSYLTAIERTVNQLQ